MVAHLVVAAVRKTGQESTEHDGWLRGLTSNADRLVRRFNPYPRPPP